MYSIPPFDPHGQSKYFYHASTTTSIPNPAPPRHLLPPFLYGNYMYNCDYSFSYKYMHNYKD